MRGYLEGAGIISKQLHLQEDYPHGDHSESWIPGAFYTTCRRGRNIFAFHSSLSPHLWKLFISFVLLGRGLVNRLSFYSLGYVTFCFLWRLMRLPFYTGRMFQFGEGKCHGVHCPQGFAAHVFILLVRSVRVC